MTLIPARALLLALLALALCCAIAPTASFAQAESSIAETEAPADVASEEPAEEPAEEETDDEDLCSLLNDDEPAEEEGLELGEVGAESDGGKVDCTGDRAEVFNTELKLAKALTGGTFDTGEVVFAEDGKVTREVFLVSPAARKAGKRRKARRVLVAKVTADVLAGEAVKLEPKLTKAGRKALRKARRAKLVVRTSYRPTGGKPTVSSRTLTVKR